MSALLPEPGPRRLLAVATLVNMVGYGVYLTAGILYFTRVVHLPTAQVGIGLSAAGAVSLAAGIPVGHLADRRGARGVYAATLVLGAVAMSGLCLADGFWLFLLFASLGATSQAAGPAARGPLIREYGGDRPADFRAYLRSVTNAGIAVGAMLAGWGVEVGTREAYLLLIAGSAASCVACAVLVMFLPPVAPTRSGPGPRWIALRDRPYVLVTVLDGVMAIQYRVLTAAVPLWLISRTSAPRWTVSAVMLVNTAIVVLFQVRVSKSIDTPRAGGIAFRRAGFAFLLSCAAISFAAGVPGWLALTMLLAAVVVHTIGEIWQAAGGFELSFSLAPAHAVGQYQGLFGMGLGLGVTIGPALGVDLSQEADRYQLRETIAALVRPWFELRTLEVVAKELDAARALWGPYRGMSEVVDTHGAADVPTVMARMDQPGIGSIVSARSPLRIDGAYGQTAAAPLLGEHTDEVLSDLLGLTQVEIGRLLDEGVVASAVG